MKKAEGITPVIGVQQGNRFGQVAVNTPPPRRAGRTNGAVGNPEPVNPLNLQGDRSRGSFMESLPKVKK
jgi:hypothetical protein